MFTIPPLSSDILALSLDGPSTPSINLSFSGAVSGGHALGWGIGWYPGDRQSAIVTKDPAARDTQVLTSALMDWSSFRSTVFFCKVRGAESGYTHTDTQPFSRTFAGRDWLFMHNGDLDKAALQELHGTDQRLLEPLGRTDSELAFVNLLAQVRESDSQARELSDVDPSVLLDWFQRMDALGSADMFVTDGQSVVCFQGAQSPKQLRYTRVQPPGNQHIFESAAARIEFGDARDSYRTALIVSSSEFSPGAWVEMAPGQMIVARRGALVWSSAPAKTIVAPRLPPAPSQPQPVQDNLRTQIQAEQSQTKALVTNLRSITTAPDGTALTYRMFEVRHTTHYEYSAPVEHSTHCFRLQPVDDPVQQVVRSELVISTPSENVVYEDVFGNQAVDCAIDAPYTKLTVEASSVVKIYASPPDDYSIVRRQSSIPLVWMPWQRQMMMPYLLPPELPESQLRELTEYAMSFVERNDYHLLRTLQDINLSIYRDYKYLAGATELSTTPFEVYASRQGVCQDFANLFICLARLLSIPARYRMGYIYTGANYANKIQSDASHAWVEVYLPFVGWRGFDPTNGCMVAQDHIRVACGRNYRDATPTSGTIFRGGGVETLSIDVKVREVFAQPE